MNMTGSAAMPVAGRKVWQSPQLSMLGNVANLTETGSQPTNESPLNVCVDSINDTGNSCQG